MNYDMSRNCIWKLAVRSLALLDIRPFTVYAARFLILCMVVVPKILKDSLAQDSYRQVLPPITILHTGKIRKTEDLFPTIPHLNQGGVIPISVMCQLFQ